MTTNEANQLLMSGGAKGVSFKVLGDNITGRIVGEPQKRPVTNTKGEIATFPSGDTIYQVVVEIATSLRDPDRPDDDGTRTLWIKNRMLAAVREAVRAAGAQGLEIGGVLSVQWIGEEDAKRRGDDPTKIYRAHYQPPPSAGNTTLMGGDGAAAPAPAAAGGPQPAVGHPGYGQPLAGGPAPDPHPAYAPAAAGGGVTYERVPPPAAAGATGSQWAQGGPAPWMAGNQPVAAQHFAPPAAAPPPVNAGNGAPPPAPPGVDPVVWARMDESQRQAVMAAVGNLPPF